MLFFETTSVRPQVSHLSNHNFHLLTCKVSHTTTKILLMQPQTFVQDKSASMPSSSASSSSIMKKPSLLTTTDLTSSAAAAVNNNGLFNFVFTSIVQDKPHISAPPANISSFDNIGLFHQYRDDNPLSACLSPHADELSIMSPVSPFTPMSSLSMYPRGSISSLNLVQQQQQHQQGCMSMSSPSTTPGSSHLTPNSILFSPFTAAATEILLSDLNQLEINTASAPTQFSFDDIIPLVGGNTASGASAGDIFSDVQNPQFNQQHHQQQQQMQQQQQQQHQFSHDLLTTQLLNGFNMSQVSARQQQTNFQVSMAGSNQYGNMGKNRHVLKPVLNLHPLSKHDTSHSLL